MLAGKTALVTGAARGIGLAISERLAAEGACVVLVDIDGATVKLQSERMSQAGLSTLALEVDVTDPAQVERMVAEARSRRGGLDVLVNNAGVAGPAKPTWEYTPEECGAVIGADLIVLFLCCRAAVPSMLEQAGGRTA